MFSENTLLLVTILCACRLFFTNITLCHLCQKGEVILDMRVVIFRGRVSIRDFLLGGVLILRDVVRILYIFFFSFYFRYIYLLYMGLVTILTYIVLIFFIYGCMFFHLFLHVLFIFSLYTHVSYYLYAIYYFCFTQRCLDQFCLKCFRNTGCQSLLAINSLLAKFFKSLC